MAEIGVRRALAPAPGDKVGVGDPTHAGELWQWCTRPTLLGISVVACRGSVPAYGRYTGRNTGDVDNTV